MGTRSSKRHPNILEQTSRQRKVLTTYGLELVKLLLFPALIVGFVHRIRTITTVQEPLSREKNTSKVVTSEGIRETNGETTIMIKAIARGMISIQEKLAIETMVDKTNAIQSLRQKLTSKFFTAI